MGRTGREIIRKRGSAKAAYIWTNVIFDFAKFIVETDQVLPGLPDPFGYDIPQFVRYPVVGAPIYFGITEGKVVEDPKYSDKKFVTGINRVPASRIFVSQDPVVTATLTWSGDERIEALLAEPGPRSSMDASGGGSAQPNENNLLIIYIEHIKRFHGYDSKELVVIKYKFYWKVSFDPVRRESDSLPERFQLIAHPLEGKNLLTGDCFPPGVQLFHEWYTDLKGKPVDRQGNPVVIMPNNFPVLLNLLAPISM